MPEWLPAFANLQPVSVTVDAARALIVGRPLAPVWPTLAGIVGILAVSVPLSVLQFRRSV